MKNIPNKAILITANVETAPAKFSGTNAPIKMDAIKICVGQRPLHKEKLFVIIAILSILVLVLGYTTFNLLRKNERAEDIVVGYLIYLEKISKVIEASDEKLKKLDYKGSFRSDDEIGFFFDQVKKVQEILNDFKLKKS